jgi:hypothetical protein
VQDFLFDATVSLERIALFTKLVAKGGCSSREKDVALDWLDELAEDLKNRVDGCTTKNPHDGGISRGGCGFQ